jgi:glutathione synthase/RimK-type ligase-like ATP-grasp enzyme
MVWLIIVDNPKRWDFSIPDIEVVSARNYLTHPDYAERRKLRVMNLCKSYAYQDTGYYVSLLAEARGHKPVPSVATIQDFKAPTVLRAMSSDVMPIIQSSLKSLHSEKFTLSIYFGRNMAQRYEPLCKKLSALFPAPLIRAHFSRDDEGEWLLTNISPISMKDIPDSHRDFVVEAARDYFLRRPSFVKRRELSRFDLAMLVDPSDTTPPSSEAALKKFEKAGEKLGIRVERIDRDDYGELAEYDGLFIRTTTSVEHYTYRFARKAEAERLAVIDDSLSILRCTNKVYLQEALARHHIPAPKTSIVHKDNMIHVMESLGLPMIMKQPDSSFSLGVVKLKTPEDYMEKTRALLENSDLLIAQEFLPTPFDWRIGVIDGEAFYACKYWMAKDHWQIYNHGAEDKNETGGWVDCVPLDQVPASVISCAVKAASLMGTSLYGVDLKEVHGKPVVIEVNDNPSIDAGIEDDLLHDLLYEKIMGSLLKRMEKRRRL